VPVMLHRAILGSVARFHRHSDRAIPGRRFPAMAGAVADRRRSITEETADYAKSWRGGMVRLPVAGSLSTGNEKIIQIRDKP